MAGGDTERDSAGGKADDFGTAGGSPTWFTLPWLWVDQTASELKTPSGTLDSSAPIVQRLQYWVDTVDTRLRMKFPDALKNTPSPHIYVTTQRDLILGSMNAAVHPAQVCVPRAVELETPGFTPMNIVGFFPNGAVGAVNSCITRDAVADQIPEIIDFYNLGNDYCNVSTHGDALVLGKDCVYNIEFTGGPESGKSSAYTATSSWIEVQKGLIQGMDSEDKLLVVLFHELGHYYRTHLSTPADRLNYFYELDAAGDGTKPAQDPALADLTDLVRRRMQQNAVTKFKAGFADVNARVVAERLGFYTIEEEADRFALETLAMVGIDPALASDTILELGAQWEAEDGGASPGEIPAAECQALADDDWKDAQGKDVVVPLGDVGDLHHSPCFRAYNMARVIARSTFTIDTSFTPSPPGGDWTALQTSF